MPFRIQTTPALLGVQTTPGKMELQTVKAPLTLNIDAPRIEMDIRGPEIRIDQTEPFAEAGLKKPLRLTRDEVQRARSLQLEGIAQIASQGRQLANIQDGGNPIKSQATENAYGQFTQSFRYGTIPTSRPRIDLIRGEVNISVNRGRVDNQTQKQEVRTTYTPAKVNIYLKQKNSIDIQYIDEKI